MIAIQSDFNAGSTRVFETPKCFGMEEFVAVLRAVSRQGVQWVHVVTCTMSMCARKRLRKLTCFASSDCVIAGARLNCTQSMHLVR